MLSLFVSILLIGDSHTVMSFGPALVAALPHVQRYAVSASAADNWLNDKICPDPKACPFVYGYATPAGTSDKPVPASFRGFPTLLQKYNPGAVIIALGTNDANQRCRDKNGMLPVMHLLDMAKGRTCYWVGPPKYTRGPVFEACPTIDQFVDRMKIIVESRHCTFIDSREILDPVTKLPIEPNLDDQIHFDAQLGTYWGAQVASRISSGGQMMSAANAL
jgi:hypothetical protein